MSDRIGLLEAIRANPGDNTPRLVYRDFLEETSTAPIDLATIAFIKASCEKTTKNGRMPKTGYQFIEHEAMSLLPNLNLLHDFSSYDVVPGGYVNVKARGVKSISWTRKGKWVQVNWHMKDLSERSMTGFEFNRGFIETIRYYTLSDFLSLAHRFASEHPFAVHDVRYGRLLQPIQSYVNITPSGLVIADGVVMHDGFLGNTKIPTDRPRLGFAYPEDMTQVGWRVSYVPVLAPYYDIEPTRRDWGQRVFLYYDFFAVPGDTMDNQRTDTDPHLPKTYEVAKAALLNACGRFARKNTIYSALDEEVSR